MSTDAETQALKVPTDTVAFMREYTGLLEKYGGEDPTQQAYLAYIPVVLLIRSVIRDDGLDPDAVNAAAKALETSQ